MNIPQYEPLIGYLEKKYICEYMENPGFLTEYKKTKELEEKIASYLNVKHCVMVNNGTVSLSLALLALGVGARDRVIVPDLTMIATPNAVKFIGAEPIFVDVRETDLLLDLEKTDEAVKAYKPKAIIMASLNGRSWGPEAWDYIWKWKEVGVKVLEDAAQSLGSKNYEGSYCGTRIGEIGSFSFSMPKILTMGQGGCLVTNNDELADKLRKLKDFGRTGGGNDIHGVFGINSKITEMQAVIGLAQLTDIEFRTRRKKEIFNLYRENLKGVGDIQFYPTDLSYVVPWFIDIHSVKRQELLTLLFKENIGTRPFYPPIHTQEAYSEINDWSYPVATKYSKKTLWLPSSLTLSDDQVIHICNTIKGFYVSAR